MSRRDHHYYVYIVAAEPMSSTAVSPITSYAEQKNIGQADQTSPQDINATGWYGSKVTSTSTTPLAVKNK